METVEHISQEWCSARGINVKGCIVMLDEYSSEVMVLCAKEIVTVNRLKESDNSIITFNKGIRYRPLKFEDLNVAEL